MNPEELVEWLNDMGVPTDAELHVFRTVEGGYAVYVRGGGAFGLLDYTPNGAPLMPELHQWVVIISLLMQGRDGLPFVANVIADHCWTKALADAVADWWERELDGAHPTSPFEITTKLVRL